MNTATKTLSQIEVSALASVHYHWMLTPSEREACLDTLIPAGLIDAEGTWYLTAKGCTALGEAR